MNIVLHNNRCSGSNSVVAFAAVPTIIPVSVFGKNTPNNRIGIGQAKKLIGS